MDRGTIIRDGATGGLEQPLVSEKLAPGGPYRSPRRLATISIALLTVDVVFALAASVADFQMIRVVERADGSLSWEDAAAYERLSLAGSLQAAAGTVTAIFFIIWFRRVYRNLGPLGTRWLRFRAGWAVAGWFVPFLSLARPKSIANDVWRASDPALPRRIQRPPDGAPVPPVLNWWWGTHLVGFADPLGFETGDDVATLDEWAVMLRWGQGADFALAAAGVLAILVVRKITARQEQRHATLTAQGAPLPPGL